MMAGCINNVGSVKETTDSNSDTSGKDSGLGSRSRISTGEYRRIGRGKLIEELSSNRKVPASIVRGRAHMLETIKYFNSPLETHIIDNSDVSTSYEKHLINNNSDRDTKYSSSTSAEKVEFRTTNVTEENQIPICKHGAKGIYVRLACNYIRLVSDKERGVYVYEVRFSPNIDSVGLRLKYLNEHRDKIGGSNTFDGITLYLPILLTNKLTTFVSKDLNDNSKIEIRILFKKKESLKNCVNFFNILFHKIMKILHYVRFERKQYDPTSPKIIPQHKLEIWPGYVTSICELESGLMLCCDVSHRLLCQKTVLDTLIEIYQNNPNQFQENSKKALLGAIIITRYNNRTYRIDDISFEKNPMSSFLNKGCEISYVEYYRIHHNIEIKDKKQPLLISMKKQHKMVEDSVQDIMICLIPEISYLTGMRDNLRSDFKLMREISTFTRVSPNQRILAVEKFYKNINNCKEAKKILSDWGLTLNQSIEYIEGRQLDEEKINFSDRSFSAGKRAEFSKYVCSNNVFKAVNLHNWLLIYSKNNKNVAKCFVDALDRNSSAFGVQVQKPRLVLLENDRVDTYVCALRKNIQDKVQIAVCICSTVRDDRYSAIKKICCAEMPIPSQVICAKTLSNEGRNRSIVQKIALQMNCKLGGSLWYVKIPFKNVMICGIDSYHDVAQKENSVSAFVGSLNDTYTKWYSKAVIQTKKEEIVSGLCSSFLCSIVAYEKENGKLPDSVVIYRDGLGDGQLELCSKYEIPQFLAAYQKGFPNTSVKITFIVVQKRTNARYFTVNSENVENPPPGTIVDSIITQKFLYDFFLVSQSVQQGTASPTHYIVLKDDANYSPDVLQRLSYKLCFLYYNWPGTIRVPASCQYAHKLAFLVGQSIRRSTSEELSTKLFYL